MTPKTDSELLHDISTRLARMEGRLFGENGGSDHADGFVGTTNERLADHSKRIRRLELWKMGILAGGAVVLWFLYHLSVVHGLAHAAGAAGTK